MRRVLLLISLLFVTPALGVTRELGTNLEGVLYYAGDAPFVDLMKTASEWRLQSNNSLFTGPVDSNGYPTTITSTVRVIMCSVTGVYGQGVILTEGTGTFTISGAGSNLTAAGDHRWTYTLNGPGAGNFYLSISATTPADNLRNIRVLIPGTESTYTTNPWNPLFLQYVANFGTIRFMDWQYTNDNIAVRSKTAQSAGDNTITLDSLASSTDNAYNGMVINPSGINDVRVISDYDGTSKQATITGPPFAGSGQTNFAYTIYNVLRREWADELPVTYYSYGMNTSGYRKGIPLALMVDLANRVQADPWFCIPIAASDSYVAAFAAYVHANLDPDLHPYIEYSNETWNSVFAFSTWYTVANGIQESLSGNIYTAGDYWFSRRSVEIWNIFADEYEEEHLASGRLSGSAFHRVMGGRGPSTGQNTNRLDFTISSSPAHAYMGGDGGLGVAFYYSEQEVTANAVQRTGAATAGGASTVQFPSAWGTTFDFTGRTVQLMSGETVLEERTIASYVKATRTATTDTPWVNPPTAGSSVRVTNQSVAALLALVEKNLTDRAVTVVDGNAALIGATRSDIKMYMYEGGVVLASCSNLAEDDPANVRLTELYRAPELYDVTLTAINRFKDVSAYAGVQCIFIMISPPSRYGREGYLETLDQSPAAAYRWRALMDFMADPPPVVEPPTVSEKVLRYRGRLLPGRDLSETPRFLRR